MKKKIIILGLLLTLIVYPTSKTKNYNIDNLSYKEGTNISASDYLIEKANEVGITNYTDGNTAEMYTFLHEATEQTDALTDYRYIGDNPNNYVYFNCDNNGENCETWRIIGVFTVEDENGNSEQRVKIVRGSGLKDDMKWDNNKVNDWATSSLKTYLNETYLSSLSTLSKSMIGNTKYYLGGKEVDASPNYGTVDDIYTWERGTEVYSGRSTSWTGKIALLYPSELAHI